MCHRRVQPGLVEVILSYCHCCLVDRSLLELLPYLAGKSVGVINASILSMGLLTKQARLPNPGFQPSCVALNCAPLRMRWQCSLPQSVTGDAAKPEVYMVVSVFWGCLHPSRFIKGTADAESTRPDCTTAVGGTRLRAAPERASIPGWMCLRCRARRHGTPRRMT